MSRSRAAGGAAAGLGRALSLRMSEVLAACLEEQRTKISRQIGTNVSASEMLRHAVEKYLVDAGYDIQISPWPSAPLEDKVRMLEAEVERLRRLVPKELPAQDQAEPFFQ